MSQQATQQRAFIPAEEDDPTDQDFEGQVDNLVENGMEPVQAGANPDQLNQLFGLVDTPSAS